MKRKDFLLIAVVIIISTAFALFLASFLIGSPEKHPQEAEIVQPISANFPPADQRYFNGDSINPTKLITIGDNTNPSPFNSPKP